MAAVLRAAGEARGGGARPRMRVLRLWECAVPVYDQLVLEEYLLRHTTENWCGRLEYFVAVWRSGG